MNNAYSKKLAFILVVCTVALQPHTINAAEAGKKQNSKQETEKYNLVIRNWSYFLFRDTKDREQIIKNFGSQHPSALAATEDFKSCFTAFKAKVPAIVRYLIGEYAIDDAASPDFYNVKHVISAQELPRPKGQTYHSHIFAKQFAFYVNPTTQRTSNTAKYLQQDFFEAASYRCKLDSDIPSQLRFGLEFFKMFKSGNVSWPNPNPYFIVTAESDKEQWKKMLQCAGLLATQHDKEAAASKYCPDSGCWQLKTTCFTHR